MTSKSYTHVWCAVKGDTSWSFRTEAEAEAQATDVSQGEQVDVYELVDGAWVWRFSQLTVLLRGEAA